MTSRVQGILTHGGPAFLSSGRAAREWIHSQLGDAVDVRIAIYRIDDGGLDVLERDWLPLVEASQAKWWILGAARRRNEDDLATLRRITTLCAHPRVRVRTVAQRGASNFHAKVYVVTRRDGSTAAMVGSSNLTGVGLGANVESNVGFARADEALKRRVITWFDACWRDSDLPDVVPAGEREAGRRVDPPPPPPPPIRYRLAAAIEGGLVAELVVYVRSAVVSLPPELLRVEKPMDVEGDFLSLRAGSRLTLNVIPPEALRELNNLRARGQRTLHAYTLNSPWGRFVPANRLHAFERAIPHLKDDIRVTLEKVESLTRRPVVDYVERIRSEFITLWARLHGAGTHPPDESIEALLKGAEDQRRLFLEQGALPLSARLRLDRVAVPAGSGTGVLDRELAASSDEDVKRFAITAASAPRRSILKYREPEIARQLCVLPDEAIDAAAQHQWKNKGGAPTASAQVGMFDGQTTGEHGERLRREVAEIRAWHALTAEEVLEKYADMIAGQERAEVVGQSRE